MWLVFAALLISGFHGSWARTWLAVGVVTLAQPFGDTRVIPNAVDLVRAGIDPYVARAGYPTLNYPRIWVSLFSVTGLNHHVRAFELGIIAGLFACLSHLILTTRRMASALCVWLASLSWVVCLVVERGNIDMVAFLLTYLSIATPYALASALLLTLAAVLKLYPGAVFLVAPALGKKPLHFFGAGFAFFLLYIAASWHDIQAMQRNTPYTYIGSYGISAIDAQFGRGDHRLSHGLLLLAALALCLVLFTRGWRAARAATSLELPGQALFLAFGTVFVATFLLTPNFLYRLIFLIPMLPFWCELSSVRRHARAAGGGIALTLISLDSPLVYHMHHFLRVIAAAIYSSRIALFALCCYFLGWAFAQHRRRLGQL